MCLSCAAVGRGDDGDDIALPQPRPRRAVGRPVAQPPQEEVQGPQQEGQEEGRQEEEAPPLDRPLGWPVGLRHADPLPDLVSALRNAAHPIVLAARSWTLN